MTTEKEALGGNSRFAKAGVSCFYDSEVLNLSFVHLMKFSAKNPRLRKAAKRYAQCGKFTLNDKDSFDNNSFILFEFFIRTEQRNIQNFLF
jgi:hypothetical protein